MRRPATRVPARPWLAPVGLPVALLALHTVRFGYGYGGGDHDELIPSALALLSGGALFERDWLVQTVLDGVNVRTAFVWLLALGGRVMPLVAWTAALHVATWLATAAGVFALGWTLTRSRLGAAIGAALALVVAVAFPIGANSVVSPLLTPESLAWAALVPALALWLRGHPAAAGALIGAAAWVHLLAAGLVGLWIGITTLTRRGDARRLPTAFVLGATALAAAAPVLVPVALDQLAGGADPAGPSPFEVHAVFRNPWHHLFFSFPAATHLKFWTWLALGVSAGVWLARRGRLRHAGDLARLGAVAAVAGIVGVLLVEGWPVEAVAKLQVFKLAVPVTLLAALALGGALAAALPAAWRTRGRAAWDRRSRLANAAVLLVVGAVGVWSASGRGPLAARLQPVAHPATPAGQVEAWARANTPAGALFAVPPSRSTFRSYARRAVVITWNGVVFGDAGMQAWRRRLHDVAPIATPPRGSDPRDALDQSYASRSAAAWAALCETYGVDYAVVPDSVRLPYPTVFTAGEERVIRLTACRRL